MAMSSEARFQVDYRHRVEFTRGVFSTCNPLLADLFAGSSSARALVVIDRGLLDAQPQLEQQVRNYFEHHAPRMPRLMGFRACPGGEESKNDLGILEGLLGDIHRTGLCRQSYLIAIGGGALIDMAGFAAAVAHRGVRLIRLPTTTLAQADAAIGVKNSINMFGKKNFLGTFALPHAVINDLDTLDTLSDRDWRSGASEAVKVALLKDAAFFEQLEHLSPALAQRDSLAGEIVWRRCAQLHIDHIVNGGDPFENRVARPLDLGHWSAHRLESLSRFELRHGEAVAIGLAIDTAYAHLAGLMDRKTADRIIDCLKTIGFELFHPALRDTDSLLSGIQEFREHLGGELTITLPAGIGRPVDVHEINSALMTTAIQSLWPLPHSMMV